MEISRKEKMIHVCSLLATVFVIVLFFILGGGSGAEADVIDSNELNSSVPSAMERTLSSDRFAAVRREEQMDQDRKRLESLQKNSFDLFNTNNTNSKSPTKRDSALVQVSEPSGGRRESRKSLNNSKHYGKTESGLNESRKEKAEIKSQIMRQKRARLERELGINLSDYGYDKYASDEDSSKKRSVEMAMASQDETEGSIEYSQRDSEAGGFYGLDQEYTDLEHDIRAVFHGSHDNISSGSIVKLRLLDDVNIDGIRVPANTFVFGKLSFKSGRAMVDIQGINYRNKILKFKGSVYDTDGFEGIYVPDNVLSKTQRKASSDAISGIDIDVSSKSKIVNSTMAAFGNAIKSAVSGSIKEAKISVSSNYMITIKKKK